MSLQLTRLLPPDLRVEEAVNKLYEFGVIVKPLTTHYTHRHWLSHPVIKVLIHLYYILMFIIFIVNNNHNKRLVIILGDYPTLLGVGFHLHFPALLYFIFNLFTVFIYYDNYWKGVKPTFLRVFAMLSGLVTPNSVGLTDTQSLDKFIKITKTMFKIMAFIHNRTTPLIGFFVIFVYLYFTTLLDTLLYGIIYTIT